MITGMDFGKEDRTILTTFPMHYFELGDTIKVYPQPNSHKTKVIKILDNKNVEIKTYIRPSRGFAKHIRRIKANAA